MGAERQLTDWVTEEIARCGGALVLPGIEGKEAFFKDPANARAVEGALFNLKASLDNGLLDGSTIVAGSVDTGPIHPRLLTQRSMTMAQVMQMMDERKIPISNENLGDFVSDSGISLM